MVGSEEELQTEVKNRTVDRSALTICQNIMYVFKTRRQVHKKSSEKFRTSRSRENSQVLGLALTVHHDTRNKMLLNFLESFGKGKGTSFICVPCGTDNVGKFSKQNGFSNT